MCLSFPIYEMGIIAQGRHEPGTVLVTQALSVSIRSSVTVKLFGEAVVLSVFMGKGTCPAWKRDPRWGKKKTGKISDESCSGRQSVH